MTEAYSDYEFFERVTFSRAGIFTCSVVEAGTHSHQS